MLIHPPDSILIIDDDPETAQLVKSHLDEAGYLTHWIADGESGLRLLHSHHYNLVLLETEMVGIDGLELLQRLRAVTIDSAVIVMTPHGNEHLIVDCIRAGANDYITKPFDIADLKLRMKCAIEIRNTIKEKLLRERNNEEFISLFSHDMKNPITAVIGSIDIIREGLLGPVNSEQVDYLQSSIESCDEVVMMIDNLIDMQRFDTGRLQTSIRQVNPHTLIADAVRYYTPAASREDIKLTFDSHSGLPEIAVDSSIMGRVISNLIGNAIKFVPEGGRIALSCRRVDNSELFTISIPEQTTVPAGFSDNSCFVHITVCDNGNGISSDDLSHIFERYIRSDNSSRRSKGGAGLGLAFCRKAVESFNGIFWAASDEKQGSTFNILIPGYINNCAGNSTASEKLT